MCLLYLHNNSKERLDATMEGEQLFQQGATFREQFGITSTYQTSTTQTDEQLRKVLQTYRINLPTDEAQRQDLFIAFTALQYNPQLRAALMQFAETQNSKSETPDGKRNGPVAICGRHLDRT